METRRAIATRAVAQTLRGFPQGRALAGQLESALTRKGVSARQARRWLHWASTGPEPSVAKTEKGAEGTWYYLQGQPPRSTTDDTPKLATLLGTLSSDVRRDVALVAWLLQEHGGTLGVHELGRLVADRAGRALLWGVATVEVAVATAGTKMMAFRRGNGPHPVVVLSPDADVADAKVWAAQPRFALPDEPEAQASRLRRLLDDPSLTLTVGQAAIVSALANLGGTATPEELHAQPFPDRGAALQVLADLRQKGWKTNWLVRDGSGRRLRLASRLWS